MAKIQHDKYYTPQHIVELVMKRVEEVVGLENITEFIEPSAGNGAFLDSLYATGIPTNAYDLYPERDDIVEQDYLKLNLEYKNGRCVIGNPPFGDKNNLVGKFIHKSIPLSDYIIFILPIGNYKNDFKYLYLDLMHSEIIIEEFSNIKVKCCLNIYKVRKNKKKKLAYKDLKIFNTQRYLKKDENFEYDFRFCCWGASIGKEVDYPNQYAKETCIKIYNENLKDTILKKIKDVDWVKTYPMTSTPSLCNWQVYKYLKEQIPELE